MSTAIIIQEHMSSRRLPNKVLKKYKEYSILDILIKRLKKSKKIKKIIIATSKNKKDIKIVDYCKKNKILYYRGPEYDVLERYYKAAKKNKLKTIIRLTSDCPLIDIKTMDKMIYIFKKKKT